VARMQSDGGGREGNASAWAWQWQTRGRRFLLRNSPVCSTGICLRGSDAVAAAIVGLGAGERQGGGDHGVVSLLAESADDGLTTLLIPKVSRCRSEWPSRGIVGNLRGWQPAAGGTSQVMAV